LCAFFVEQMSSIANKFCSWPDSEFFLRHVVMMNYAGKVYSILRGIEVVATGLDKWNQALFVSYAVFMTLGMYWYTRFWLLREDVDEYYTDTTYHHCLTLKVGNIPVTLGAAFYYALFCGLFAWSYVEISEPVSLSLSIWNGWCCANLLLATPLYK